jgi:hypothetical protein
MARYSILARMMTLPRPLAIGDADTPADAVRKARAFTADGQRDVQIGDAQSETYFPTEEFAAKHGIR